MSLKDIKNPTYFELNNQINIPVNGQIPLNKDKEAVTAFLNENVKPNRLFTYHPNTGVKTHESLNADVSSYMDKLEWLIKNDYYEEPFIRAYKPEFIEELRACLHKQNFTFYSFMAAYKFYKQYALKTNNGEYYLEDPEDRALMNALYQANGDEELAKDLARVVITRRYQPATPTYANNGRKRRGEFASCFPAGTMISTNMGKLPIEKIEKGMLVLTHDSTYKPVLETMSRQSEEIEEIKIAGQPSTIKTTPEHPFLTTSLKNFVKHPKSEFTEGITRHTFWSEAKDLEKSDYVAVAVEPHNEISTYIDSWDLLKDFTNGYGAHTLLLDNSVAVETIDTKNNRKKGTTINTRINPIPSKINLDADLGRFVGYYLAEGNLIKRDATSIHGIQLTFNSKATSIIEDTIQIIKTKFGYDAKIDKRNDGSTVVAIHNQLLGTVFYKLIGTGFDKKILNETLLGAPKEFLYNLMIGVFRGDGTQTATYNRLQLTNRELIYQLRMIALQLKLLPYTVDLVVKYNKSDASALTISGISQENVDFLNNLHNGKLELRPSSNKDIAFWLDGYAFYKVRKIDQNVNKTKVYNMDVEGNHTYVANNIIVHNCFIIQVQDNMSDIGRSITNALQLSRKAGGVGLILGNLRAAGSPIKKMDGLASGVLPVMKLFEDSFSYSNQLGTRPGAGVAYLPIFHADVMEFLSSKKENADEKIRLKTLSLGLTVPDKFYELAKAGSKMAIFDPYFVEKELGQSFTYVDMDKEYEHLVELSKQVDEETGMPKIRVKWIEARALEQAISELQQESGYPYIINISTANKANPIEGRILGSNLCVTGDTRILTNKGYQKAEDLYDSGENLIVTIDNRTKDDVATDFGVSNVQAIPMHMTNKSAKVYEIKTKEGFTLKATAYHKVYVERFVGYTWHPKTPKYEIELIPLKDLKPGDKLLIQSDSGTYGNDTFEEAAYIMGAVAGDGTFAQSKRKTLSKSVRINNFNNKLSIAEHKLEKVVSEMISDLNPELIKYQSTSNPKFKAIEQRSSATLTVLQSSNLATYLDLNFGFNRDTKCEIPERIWTSDVSTIGAYLSGLFQTDSTFHVNETYKSASIELGTIHEDFAKDIQRLLLTLGVYSRIYTSNRKKSLLPDSNRNLKEYDVKDIHSLRIQDRASIEKFVKFVTLRDTDIVKFENWQSWLSPKTRNAKHHFTAEISEIVELGFEPVYDTTQPSYHSLIFNGIVTSNCSEILQIQTPSVINEEQEYTTLGQDIVCNLGSTNIINMMNAGESFGNDIIAMTKGLTFISDASNLDFVQTIKNGNDKNHAIGLGAMGLHSFLANNQIQYESKDAVDFTGLYFLLLNYYTIMGSMQIAKERKQAFDNFENSTYATGEYFDKYLTTDYTDGVSDRVMKLFKDIHIPTAEDWAQLKAEVQEHGMFNAYRIALAPNGSISYVNDCSASIAPIVNRIEERQEGQVGKIYYPTFGLSNESIPYFKSAYDQDMRWQIRIYEAATEHTDQGLSMNMYLRSNFEEHPGLYEWKDGGTTALTTRDLTILRHFAWRHGIKSMYYTRQYTADSDSEHGGANECESCMI